MININSQSDKIEGVLLDAEIIDGDLVFTSFKIKSPDGSIWKITRDNQGNEVKEKL